MSRKRSLLEFDFAGHHGTVWGTVNLGLTVVTLTTCAYVFAGAPWWTAAGIMGGGFLLTLLRAAFRTKPTPPATVVYQLSCWAASGVWASWMLHQHDWTLRSWAYGVLVWAGVALVAGIALGLGREDKPKTTATVEPMAVPASGDGLTQGERDALGLVILDAINMLASNPRPTDPTKTWKSVVNFTALKAWDGGYGYTMEGAFTSGKFGLTQLDGIAAALAQELNLPYGCTVRAYEHTGEGAGRRDFLLDVTTRNALLDPQPFPENEGPFSINSDIPIGADPKGQRYPLHLRTSCLVVYGTTGSGKTGSMKAVSGMFALTSDCVMVGIDATGGDLVRPMLKPWEDGRAEHPAFSAVAVTYQEAEKLARALLRINISRKEGYQYILDKHNTTLLPMGALVRRDELPPKARAYFPIPEDVERMIPQIMLVGDETKEYLRTATNQPTLRGLIGKIIDETRGGGIRCVFGPLGPTNANIDQSIQSLLDSRIVMKLGDDADYRGAIGSTPIRGADFPVKADGSGKVPGIGFAVGTPGQRATQIRIWGEMKPDLVHRVAIRASAEGFIPDLDYISELAADGFKPDGSPWPKTKGLFEDGDEFYWRDRWVGWKTRREVKEGGTSAPQPVVSSGPSATTTMEKLREKIARTEQAADARVAEATGSTPEEVAFDRALVEQAAEKWPATIPAEWAGESQVPESGTWRDRVMAAIRDAGTEGATPGQLEKIDGVVRSELYKFLAAQCSQGRLHKPAKGRYAIPGDEL